MLVKLPLRSSVPNKTSCSNNWLKPDKCYSIKTASASYVHIFIRTPLFFTGEISYVTSYLLSCAQRLLLLQTCLLLNERIPPPRPLPPGSNCFLIFRMSQLTKETITYWYSPEKSYWNSCDSSYDYTISAGFRWVTVITKALGMWLKSVFIRSLIFSSAYITYL